MFHRLRKWVRSRYEKVVGSIAFYPALIAIAFLLLSWGMLQLDFSMTGKSLKSKMSWLSLKDATTARSILSTIAGSVISLAVFSFSLVMIVLNQAASQMSNRILGSMIGNRFQQVILGFYIGTVVYALFLLSTIRDINKGIYVPALSIYLCIFLTVIDIFLFIYFLDFVTQTVKYDTVIRRVKKQTLEAMADLFTEKPYEEIDIPDLPFCVFLSPESGYFQGINTSQLLDFAFKHNIIVTLSQPRGSFILEGTELARVYGLEKMDADLQKQLYWSIDVYSGQPIDRNPDYGFRHLSEVAMKALSPGINDPATAVLCIEALTQMMAYRMQHQLPLVIRDSAGIPRILSQTTTVAGLFKLCIQPIYNYGKEDILVQSALRKMLDQLDYVDTESKFSGVMGMLRKEMLFVREK